MLYGPKCLLGWKNISKRLKATCVSSLGPKLSVTARAKLSHKVSTEYGGLRSQDWWLLAPAWPWANHPGTRAISLT